MNFELHTFTFNEEFMLPKLVKWYRERMPNIRIVVHDNESTDRTTEIARALGCEVIPFSTHGQLRNGKLMDLKNSVWKGTSADFVIIADVDEMLDVDEDFLSQTDATIIRGVGINMVGNGEEMEAISKGVLDSQYDKFLCFSPKAISAINYSPGAHTASPVGEVKMTQAPLFHYKWLSPEYVQKRTELINPRRSLHDKLHKRSTHYKMTREDIYKRYQELREKAVSVSPKW